MLVLVVVVVQVVIETMIATSADGTTVTRTARIDAIVTTGGTGITGRDVTPEAFARVLEKEIAGFGELFRMLSYAKIGTSTMQSRAIGGVADGTYLFALPGSTGAVKVSTSPTTVTVTVPSSSVEVDSVITSSKGASVPSVDTSGCPSAGRSEVVTDSGSSRRAFPGGDDRSDNLPLCGPGARRPRSRRW